MTHTFVASVSVNRPLAIIGVKAHNLARLF